MDRGAWQATAHGVPNRWIQLSNKAHGCAPYTREMTSIPVSEPQRRVLMSATPCARHAYVYLF